MSRDKLGSLLRLSEEGPQVKDYDPTAAIDHWYGQKRVGFGSHDYPKKPRKKKKRAQRLILRHTLSEKFAHRFFLPLIRTLTCGLVESVCLQD